MTVTDRVLLILRVLRRYKFVTTAQIRAWCVPMDRDGSITREVMRKMRDAGLARRVKAEVHDPIATSSAPVWLPTEAGSCVLASHTGDMSLLLDCPPNASSWQNLAHWCQVSEQMHTIEMAFAGQNYARMGAMYLEHDMVNPREREASKRYKTYTVVRQDGKKQIVCVPDSCFEVIVGQSGQYRRAYYVELERGTDAPRRVAAKKSPGYAGLFETDKWRLHFPHADGFRVLCVATRGSRWRDELRSEFKGKPGAELWLFAAIQDLRPETFLHEQVLYGANDGPKPFLRRPALAPEITPTQEQATGNKIV